LLTHIAAIAMIALSTRFDDYRVQIGSILIITPVTLIYASAFMKYVVANATPESGEKPSEVFDPMAAVTMYLVVFVFCLSLTFLVVKFSFYSSYQVNEFKMWLGASETAFGALIGVVFDRLFGVVASEGPQTRGDAGKDASRALTSPGSKGA
jgi:hypothetical protein